MAPSSSGSLGSAKEESARRGSFSPLPKPSAACTIRLISCSLSRALNQLSRAASRIGHSAAWELRSS